MDLLSVFQSIKITCIKLQIIIFSRSGIFSFPPNPKNFFYSSLNITLAPSNKYTILQALSRVPNPEWMSDGPTDGSGSWLNIKCATLSFSLDFDLPQYSAL